MFLPTRRDARLCARRRMPTLDAMHFAVVDPLPMYQEGVVAVLTAAGHTAEIPPDPLAWARRDSAGMLLLTLADAADWQVLHHLSEEMSAIGVIALMPDGSAAAG